MHAEFLAYFSKTTNIIFNKQAVYGFNYLKYNQTIDFKACFNTLSDKFIQKAFRGIKNNIRYADGNKLIGYSVIFSNGKYSINRMVEESTDELKSLLIKNNFVKFTIPSILDNLIPENDSTCINTLSQPKRDTSKMKNISNIEIYNTVKSNMEKGNEVFYNGKSIKLVHIKYDTLLGERVMIVDDTKDEYICNNTDLSSITISTKLFK